MTQLVAKYAMKKVMGRELEKYKSKSASGPYDPYYEEIPHPRKPGKTKKVKKQIPAYIPSHDADILAKARKTAYRLDFALFNFAGLRFGWSSVIGLVPAIGDAVDGLLALNLILTMRKIQNGLPQAILIRMLINLVIDFAVGLIPFLGDLADAAIKCNGKNVRLLEQHLDNVYKPQELVARDSKLPREQRPRPASVYVDFSDDEDMRNNTFDGVHDNVAAPQRAYSGRREKTRDEEMGLPRHDTHKSIRDERPNRQGTKHSRR